MHQFSRQSYSKHALDLVPFRIPISAHSEDALNGDRLKFQQFLNFTNG